MCPITRCDVCIVCYVHSARDGVTHLCHTCAPLPGVMLLWSHAIKPSGAWQADEYSQVCHNHYLTMLIADNHHNHHHHNYNHIIIIIIISIIAIIFLIIIVPILYMSAAFLMMVIPNYATEYSGPIFLFGGTDSFSGWYHPKGRDAEATSAASVLVLFSSPPFASSWSKRHFYPNLSVYGFLCAQF